MSDAKTYKGSCHCGKVSYEVKTDLAEVMSCNCSICSKKGYLLNFVAQDQFNMVSGNDALSDYQFNKKNIHHLFCTGCGIQSFARGTSPDGKAMVAVNVRCLEGVDLDKLEITKVDGRRF
jgi:hypothetical protein